MVCKYWGCNNLRDIILLQDEPVAVENIGENAFPDGIATKATLWVRHMNVDQYRKHDFWGQFAEVKTSFFSEDDQIEYMPVSTTNMKDYDAVDILAVKCPNYTLTIPQTAVDGDGNTYKVTMLGDYAFEECASGIHEVIVEHRLDYIGARAFINNIDEGQVRNVFFLSTEPAVEISMQKFAMPERYNEFSQKQMVYVKKSALDEYKTSWPRLWEQGNLDYRIACDVDIKSQFATLAREFDIDLGDVDEATGERLFWNSDMDCPQVIAFTGLLKNNTSMTGEDAQFKYVRLESINAGGDKNMDGLYVPKGTGVLLKAVTDNGVLAAYSEATRPDGFYYRIAENQGACVAPADNVMQAVIVNPTTIDPTDGNFVNFYVSDGQLHRFTRTLQMPVHRSYMSLEGVGEAKVMMVFGEGDDVAAIETIDNSQIVNTLHDTLRISQSDVFDLQGRCVAHPTRGIYVRNGQKIVMK